MSTWGIVTVLIYIIEHNIYIMLFSSYQGEQIKRTIFFNSRYNYIQCTVFALREKVWKVYRARFHIFFACSKNYTVRYGREKGVGKRDIGKEKDCFKNGNGKRAFFSTGISHFFPVIQHGYKINKKQLFML